MTQPEIAESILTDPDRRRRLLKLAWARYQIASGDAEEILQETALQVLCYRSYIRNPDAFVLAVFKACCARFIAGVVTARQLVADLPAAVDVDSFPDPFESDDFQRRMALREAIWTVSSACRRFLSAYYIEGEDLREVARRLSLAYSSASKTLSRCLKKLRECLA